MPAGRQAATGNSRPFVSIRGLDRTPSRLSRETASQDSPGALAISPARSIDNAAPAAMLCLVKKNFSLFLFLALSGWLPAASARAGDAPPPLSAKRAVELAEAALAEKGAAQEV